MKLCWDNMERITLSQRGNFLIDGKYTALYMESCNKCSEPYLTYKIHKSEYCCISCTKQGAMNPMYNRTGKSSPNYGRKRTEESRAKMSASATGRRLSDAAKLKVSAANTGKKHSKEAILKMSKAKLGKKMSEEAVENMRKSAKRGSDSPLWKGGIRSSGLPLYNTYADRIKYAEEVLPTIHESGITVVNVKCNYCGKWFLPTITEVEHRIGSLEGRAHGEKRLYCSSECKVLCPVFNRIKYPKGFKHGSSREVDSYIRKLCFERDSWECQKCSSTDNLHCHHINSYSHNKMIANDIDNCLTLCKYCHREVHTGKGCRYIDLRCKEEL